MSTNPLAELPKLGQSVWYDQMQRSLAIDGKLQEMIERDDLRGLTSNPTIFEKAIGGTSEYDATLQQLTGEGRSVDEIYEAIVVEDIGLAADVFRPVYEKTGGLDGYCSLEVSPRLALDTRGTVEEGLKLFKLLGRPNVMIKVPATAEGIPAIEELIYNGVNVNVTLIFSTDVYQRVIDAYMAGLQRRVAEGQPVGYIASVASFFVSRIDTKVDAAIDAKIASGAGDDLKSLKGTIAIANAKAAYQLFLENFRSAKFQPLRDAGAMVQRPLWASTGTKSADYSDVLYVESLIGSDTVNTLPPATYDAFRDHGLVEPTIEQGVDQAMQQLRRLEAGGISLDAITRELTDEGVKSFADSFGSLIGTIEARRAAALRDQKVPMRIHPGIYGDSIEEIVRRAGEEKWVEKIWKRDAALWKTEEEHRAVIDQSLGWLRVPFLMLEQVDQLIEFAESVRGDYSDVVVLGMGGSSLASEVTGTVLGAGSGWPRLHVLDSTVPESVLRIERAVDLSRTLFIYASKSGTTTEPAMLFRYFWNRVSASSNRPGHHFVAVTDPGTQLEREAGELGFRRVFLNWADIGGRYSALSMFGMVPAALSGMDVRLLLERGARAAQACSPAAGAASNAGLRLGAVMGALASRKIDKMTLLLPRPIESLGLWVEQLVAESTGKEGRGILPIAMEPLLEAEAYSGDRFFVSVSIRGHEDPDIRGLVRDLAAAGRPVVEIQMEDGHDVGDLFFLFEFATAVACRVLGVNPFDQPNVQESKTNTNAVLDEVRSSGSLPTSSEGYGPDAVRSLIDDGEIVSYFAVLAYIDDNEGHRQLLHDLRAQILRRSGKPVTGGFGPRYLHSTGQLHKGGGPGGRFIVITADPIDEVPIPAESFGFGTLARAQAAGDIRSLRSHGGKVAHVHLERDTFASLRELTASTAARS